MRFTPAPDHELPVGLPRRRAARLILQDGLCRVLLLRHDAPLHHPHWAGAGGGLDPGESPEQALRRELCEELSLTATLRLHPIGSWRHRFLYHGADVVQHEQLFWARLTDVHLDTVGLGWQACADGIGELRWWALEELRETREDIWPSHLAEWIDGPEAKRLGESP